MVTGQVRTILRLALAHILVILLRSVSQCCNLLWKRKNFTATIYFPLFK